MSSLADTSSPSRIALKRPAILGGLALFLGGVFIFSLATGPVPVTISDVFRTLTGQEVDQRTAAIILMLRLPRALLAILVGGALAGAGAALASSAIRWLIRVLSAFPAARHLALFWSLCWAGQWRQLFLFFLRLCCFQ